MAEEIQIRNSPAMAKIRNPLGVSGCGFITLGIYLAFWWYFINREMRDLGQARGRDLGQSPGNSVLAVTLGALIIVPAIVSEWRTSMRIQQSQETVGVQPTVSGPIIFILLILIGPVGLVVRPERAEQGVGGGALRWRAAGARGHSARSAAARARGAAAGAAAAPAA